MAKRSRFRWPSDGQKERPHYMAKGTPTLWPPMAKEPLAIPYGRGAPLRPMGASQRGGRSPDPPSLAIGLAPLTGREALWPKGAFGQKRGTAPLTAYPTYGRGLAPLTPTGFPHITPTSPTFPQHPPSGKNVGKRITYWLRTTYEAISPLPQHFPFFRWLKNEIKNRGRGVWGREEEKRKEPDKKLRDVGEVGKSGM